MSGSNPKSYSRQVLFGIRSRFVQDPGLHFGDALRVNTHDSGQAGLADLLQLTCLTDNSLLKHCYLLEEGQSIMGEISPCK